MNGSGTESRSNSSNQNKLNENQRNDCYINMCQFDWHDVKTVQRNPFLHGLILPPKIKRYSEHPYKEGPDRNGSFWVFGESEIHHTHMLGCPLMYF